MNSSPTYRDVVGALTRADLPVRELRHPGHVAVTLAAGRIMGLAFSADGPNLLWSHPQINDADLLKHHPEKLAGGMGGDRLWFAPELDYFWQGVPDWVSFVNYQVPAASDPGAYEFVDAGPESIGLRASGRLIHRNSGNAIGFEIERSVRMTPAPWSAAHPLMRDVEYVGVETSHVLQLDRTTASGRIDLWHLLQAPAGSVLIVPLNETATAADKTPLSYALPGAWQEKSKCILWRYTGRDGAKFGLSAAAVTGRTAVLQTLSPTRRCLIVREFDASADATYADYPHGSPRTDQVFQAWDGYDFGEMEYHSPALDAAHGPRLLRQSDRLWAFGGSPDAINELGKALLGVDISDIELDRGAESG